MIYFTVTIGDDLSTVIDFAAGVPSASAVKRAGHIGAVRYLSPPRAAWMKGKPIHKKEVDDYKKNGLELAYVWQFGKEAAPDVRRGRAGGIADAKAAQKQLDAIGDPKAPVFFAIDYDISVEEWNRVGAEYFRGVNSVLGVQRTGIYGHSRVCHWAGPEDGLVGKVATGRYLAWVTRSWSAGQTGKDYAVLYQRVVDTPSTPGPKVNGVTVDVNDVFHENWGQKPLPKIKAPSVPAKTEDKGYDIDLSHRITFGKRTKLPKRIVILHTTENSLGTRAASVLGYQVDTRSGSYHRMTDKTGQVVLANSDDWQTWSTGNIGNDIALHLSIVWWAKTTRPEWLSEPVLLNSVARVFAYWSRKYDIPLRKLTREQLLRQEPGFAGHLEAQVWGNTTHWDPGYHFPYDVVLDMARQINSAPAHVVEAEHTFMEAFMAEAIRSLINPEKEFSPGALLGIMDATNWQTNKAVQGLYEALGLDYQGYIDACVEADRKRKPAPSISQHVK